MVISKLFHSKGILLYLIKMIHYPNKTAISQAKHNLNSMFYFS
jgi:hypothetical protein